MLWLDDGIRALFDRMSKTTTASSTTFTQSKTALSKKDNMRRLMQDFISKLPYDFGEYKSRE